jgi:hypothetical protein
MLLKKYNSIMAKSEGHRNNWAFGLTVVFSVFIFVSFAFYRGYLSFGNVNIMPKNQAANVISAKSAPSPIQNTKETFKSAFKEIGKQYGEFTDSISSVLVPFFTGIEVYNRK